MDNASFRFLSPRIQERLAEAGVLIQYTAPYSPDLNPNEPFFGSVKNWIRKRSREDEVLIKGDFKSYLRIQIRVFGRDKKIAKGHFTMAQIYLEE
jgi:transposase